MKGRFKSTMTASSRANTPFLGGREARYRLWVIAVFSIANASAHGATNALARFPNAGRDGVTFVARGDIWTVPLSGGVAKRLTKTPGQKFMPRYSPDGKWIAFTEGYGGRQNVCIVPADGSAVSTPLTIRSDGIEGTEAGFNPDNLVVTWTPDSKFVVFLSHAAARNPWGFDWFEVSVRGGLPRRLPIQHPGLGTFSPDGRHIVFASDFRDFDMRKRYDGGLAQHLRIYDLDARRLTRLREWKGSDTSPMWVGNKIYFLSDRGSGRRANIWVYDQDGRTYRQVTFFTDFDVDFPSLGGGLISFQTGGKLYLLDLRNERIGEIELKVPDDGSRTGPRTARVGGDIRASDMFEFSNYSLSPDGAQAAFSARGHIFSVNADGKAADITEAGAVNEDHPVWSPAGDLIAHTTDAGGEWQISIRSLGSRKETVVTDFKTGYLFAPCWSPDSRYLALPDANRNLWLVDVQGRSKKLVARDRYSEIMDASFSPDGKWLAFSTVRPNQQRGIHLDSMATGDDAMVSSPLASDRMPRFAADDASLYFVSSRHEELAVSGRFDGIAAIHSDSVFVASLNKAGTSAPTSEAERTPEPSKPGPFPHTAVDLAGLMSRAMPLTSEAADIASLDVRNGNVFFETLPVSLTSGDAPGESSALHCFNLHTATDSVIVRNLDNYAVSLEGETILYKTGDAWQFRGTKADGKVRPLDVQGLQIRVEPRREWAEIFRDAWRLERDLFFSPAMNGVDWRAAYDAYERLLPLAGSRDDVTYLLGQLFGELANSHLFVWGGDDGSVEDAAPARLALLGADYELDDATRRYRFSKILQGDNTRHELRSPLTAPGLDLAEGDFLLAVNGKELRAPTNPFGLFQGLNAPVTIDVSRTALGPRRKITVPTLRDEEALREEDWVQASRSRVDHLSRGQVGYVYIRDFHDDGLRTFVRDYYAQLDKPALILDIRWNLGGSESQFVLEKLRARLVGQFLGREGGQSSLPREAAPRAQVAIINEYTASDGDQFAYYFREYGLGKLLGMRTWGGVRGVAAPWTVVDGGRITVPRDSLFSNKGSWIVENEGVEPDRIVRECETRCAPGDDRQLDAAVAQMLEVLEHNTQARPSPPSLIPAYPPQVDVGPPQFH